MSKNAMTESELIGLIAQYEKSSLGASVAAGATVGGSVLPAGRSAMNTLEVDRYNAINAYYGRPLGNEVPDRSQVVIPEFRDTIEWVMPQLMRMFAATGKICQFEAENGQDEDQADIETEVVNHVFMKENNGFFVLHDMFKDALMLRNGYGKVYWEESDKTSVENYTGLQEQEVTELLQTDDDSTVEVMEQNETQTLSIGPDGVPTMVPVFDLKVRRTATVGMIKIECIPPEETLVSPKARHSLNDAPFVEHKTRTTRTSLREQGFDDTKVEAIGNGTPDWINLIALARNEVTDQLAETSPSDDASKDVDLREIYIRCDFDGDGVSELRRVMMGGDTILENEECEEIPIAYASPIRMPHRHVGISYYDLLADLQIIKTTLFRQGLDNLYAGNNGRVAINYQTVNLDDLLTSRPNGVVRVNGSPMAEIMQMPVDSQVFPNVLNAMGYVDNMREMRTGIGKDTMGLDADALQDVTKGGQLASMSAAALKVELVARMLAEGVKDLFLKVHNTLIRHQDKKMTVQIAGRWVDVNPSEWRERSKITINVGLGSGNREEARNNLGLLMKLQETAGNFGLVSPKEAFESYKEGARLLGYENPERFVMNPQSQEYHQAMQQKQSQPNPEMMKIQSQSQASMQEAQMKAQIESQDDQRRLQVEQQNQQMQAAQVQQQQELEARRALLQSQHDAQLQQMKMESDARIAYAKQQSDQESKAAQMLHEYNMEQMRIQAQQTMDKYKADLASSTSITTAQIAAQVQAAAAEASANQKIVQDLGSAPVNKPDPLEKMAQMHSEAMGKMSDVMTSVLTKPKKAI